MVYLFYTTYINVDVAHHDIFNAKVCKGGIKIDRTIEETTERHELK